MQGRTVGPFRQDLNSHQLGGVIARSRLLRPTSAKQGQESATSHVGGSMKYQTLALTCLVCGVKKDSSGGDLTPAGVIHMMGAGVL